MCLLMALQKSYKEMVRKRTKSWWNKAALEQYLTCDLIPRGLRIQAFPSFALEDETFKSCWEEACRICSRTFIELLIGYEKRALKQIDKTIQPLQDKLKSTLTPNLHAKSEEQLEKDYEK